MSFPAHQPIRAVCVVVIYSPSALAATPTAAYCKEVGQKPNFVSVFLWSHHSPYPCVKTGEPLPSVGLSGVTCPQFPLWSAT